MSEIAPSALRKEATLGFKTRMAIVQKSKRHAEREIAELASQSRRDFPKLVPRVAALGGALPVPPPLPNAVDRRDGQRHLGGGLRRFWRPLSDATEWRPSEQEAADRSQRGDSITRPCRWCSDGNVGDRPSRELAPTRVDVRELRAEEEDLRRVIHPH